ncbi:His/Gly/Thr/Pro-type tRNA ligase C-terminal domain-containing protein [Burkholderia ambifaria]|uniref:Anticodon-binding domain protein n=1 Tax=Burkholderia ambifaria MEX-5 TaxID=396597 RepID=B1SYH5_9BURK|nr:His/Gly/Thr/Pro-type tRNA ligase C-terminal domain-containing protein [Burkholderia ambifaria]EDT43606.1 Anticodon-binding domain protein [Burkholderia ambifaria MEX-5]
MSGHVIVALVEAKQGCEAVPVQAQRELVEMARNQSGCRVLRDFRAERLPRKIFDAGEVAAPIVAIAGCKEVLAGEVSLRSRDGEQHVLTINDALADLKQHARVPSATRVFSSENRTVFGYRRRREGTWRVSRTHQQSKFNK